MRYEEAERIRAIRDLKIADARYLAACEIAPDSKRTRKLGEKLDAAIIYLSLLQSNLNVYLKPFAESVDMNPIHLS